LLFLKEQAYQLCCGRQTDRKGPTRNLFHVKPFLGHNCPGRDEFDKRCTVRCVWLGDSVGDESCFESCLQSGSESASSLCCSVPSVLNQCVRCSRRCVVHSTAPGLEMQARPSLGGNMAKLGSQRCRPPPTELIKWLQRDWQQGVLQLPMTLTLPCLNPYFCKRHTHTHTHTQTHTHTNTQTHKHTHTDN